MRTRLAGSTITFLVGVSAAVAAGSIIAPAAAQDKPVHLKLSHWVPPSHPLQKALEDWGGSIQKATNGTVTFTVFPSQQLGKAFDHYDMARDGIADVTYISPGYQPGRFPIIDAGNLPFMMSNAKGGSQALDAWYRKYAATEMKDVKFCLGFVHDYGSFHSKTKKIMVPADIKGMKIRPAHATIATLVTTLGGTNVQASAPEVRDIIDKGVAEAVTFPWGSIPLFGIDKVTKYHMNMPLYVTSFAWVMNKAKYEGMSAAQKKAIDDHCTNEWSLRVAAPWADFERAGVAKLQADTASGREVYTISDAQVAEWKKAAEPVVKAWADGVRKAGANPDAVLADLKATLVKYNSAY
jgi:TRAP-type C4-dicarboxylate transport system substrate-binding protein